MYNKGMKISIIVPVLNAEKYIERCISSVIKSLDGIKGEILVIDNDSQDNSLEILKKYAKKYPEKITVLRCHKPGAAAVRNFGVSKAQGEYLWFIDGDDWISDEAIPKLIKVADRKEADLVMLGAERVYDDGRKNYLSPVSPKEPNYKSRFVRYGMGPWQVLIKRNWWAKNGFLFKEGFIHEDMELMSVLILYTNRFACIDEPLYYYSQNPGSVLHQKKFDPHVFDIFPALEGLYARFEKIGKVSSYHDELEWFFIWNLLIDSAKDFAQFPEGRPGFVQSRELLKKYFPKWRKNKFLKAKPLKLQLRVKLNYFR